MIEHKDIEAIRKLRVINGKALIYPKLECLYSSVEELLVLKSVAERTAGVLTTEEPGKRCSGARRRGVCVSGRCITSHIEASRNLKTKVIL